MTNLENCNLYLFWSGVGSGGLEDPLLVDLVKVWQQFRDPGTGFWCDSLDLTQEFLVEFLLRKISKIDLPNFSSFFILILLQVPCGPLHNYYSSAGTGMGLATEAVMTELGNTNCITAQYPLARFQQPGGCGGQAAEEPDRAGERLAQGVQQGLHGPLHKQRSAGNIGHQKHENRKILSRTRLCFLVSE